MNLIIRLILLVVVLNVFGVCLSKMHDRKNIKNSRRVRATYERPPSEDSSIRGAQEVMLYTLQGYGILCSNNWDKRIADVACRQMGFLRGAEKVIAGRYSGNAGSTLFLNSVYCSFWAQNLHDCDWETVTACPTGNTVRVVCLQNEVIGTRSRDDVSVRLMDGTRLSGRVEVKYKGEWGVICDDNWDDNDASVVCRMLGFHGESTALHRSFYGPGNGSFFLDEVECEGLEQSIDHCEHSGWKNHDCTRSEVAAVRCMEEVTGTKSRDDVSVRLMDGPGLSGRVEVKYKGEWGVICDDNWDDNDATVVCRMLGFHGESMALYSSFYGPGNGAFFLDEVECEGLEQSIDHCEHNGWKNHDCTSSEVAAVHCMVDECDAYYEFTCTEDNSCVSLHAVCDGTCQCSGCSDEKTCENCFSVASEYTGSTKHTTSGHTCQAWASNLPHRHKYHTDSYFPDKSVQAAGNKCRSPDNDVTPWCYTTNPYVLWEYCNVSKCEENCFNVAFEYTGPTNFTTSDHTCQAWASNSPHSHKYHTDSNFPEKSVQAAGNKCRSPDNDPTPWCYTTNANVRWEYCNVSRCAGGGFNFSSSCGIIPQENKEAVRDFDEDDILYSFHKMGRIYGGTQSTYGMYPWQAAVQSPKGFCGGTIIDKYWVVSAAHCFINTMKDQIVVRTGDYNSFIRDEHEERFAVDNIITHELYNSSSNDCDIALLKLRSGLGIKFNDYVQPACLPDETTPYHPGQKCRISGWGEHESGSPSTVLKEASVPIVDASTCYELYNMKNLTITSNMVCAGPLRGGTDTCQGDSGGPMVCKIQDKYTLMGVTSFGYGCAERYAPGVYAKVSRFVPWIRSRLAQYG